MSGVRDRLRGKWRISPSPMGVCVSEGTQVPYAPSHGEQALCERVRAPMNTQLDASPLSWATITLALSVGVLCALSAAVLI
jgi:hypothetical protein